MCNNVLINVLHCYFRRAAAKNKQGPQPSLHHTGQLHDFTYTIQRDDNRQSVVLTFTIAIFFSPEFVAHENRSNISPWGTLLLLSGEKIGNYPEQRQKKRQSRQEMIKKPERFR